MTIRHLVTNKWFVLVMTTITLAGEVGIPFTAMPVLFSSVKYELRLDLAQIGMIWGALPLGVAIFSLPGGLLGDRFGFRKVIGITCLIIALVNGLRGTSNSPVMLIVLMFLCGASIGIIVPNLPKVAGLFFPIKQLGMAIGIINSGFNIGSIFATALGAAFILPLLGSWRNVLFFYGIISAVLGITWLLLFQTVDSGPVKTGTHMVERNVPFSEALGMILRVRDIWLLVIAGIGILGSFLSLVGYVPLYLENSGLSKTIGDTISSSIFIAGMIGTVIFPALSDRIGKRKPVLIGCAAVVCIATCLLSVSNAEFFWLLLPLIGAATMGVGTLSLTIPLELKEIGTVYGASAMGIVIAGHNLGGFILPLIGGNIAEINQAFPFIFWAILIFIGVLCLSLVRETGHKKKY